MKQEKKKQTVFKKYIENRIYKKNKNFFMIVVGSTGSGKSYTALRLAELLDPSFNIDRCCFKALEFMKKIKELQNLSEKEQEKIRGKVVLWDEIGTQHNAREFMTISNRAINFFFQTSRYLNLIIIMTVPLLSFIDSATRKLSHCIAETTGINSRTKMVSLKVKMLQVNVMSGKEFFKYLRYRKNNKTYSLRKIKVGLPSEKNRVPYEKRKKEFGDWLYDTGINKLEKIEYKDMKENKILKPLSPMQEKVRDLLIKMSVNKASKELNISSKVVYGHKVAMEKKGYLFKPVWKDKRVIRYEMQDNRGFTVN